MTIPGIVLVTSAILSITAFFLSPKLLLAVPSAAPYTTRDPIRAVRPAVRREFLYTVKREESHSTADTCFHVKES